MLITTQVANIRGYMGSVYQISTLIIAFTLSGIIAQEISGKTLILPVCTGKRYDEMLLAKGSVYGGFLLLVTTLSALVNYGYAGALFGFDLPSVLPALRAGALQGLLHAVCGGPPHLHRLPGPQAHRRRHADPAGRLRDPDPGKCLQPAPVPAFGAAGGSGTAGRSPLPPPVGLPGLHPGPGCCALRLDHHPTDKS
jgi:hypothetical protein